MPAENQNDTAEEQSDDSLTIMGGRAVNEQRSVNAHVGASIKAKVKRGTDTRDQDELVIKGKGADAEEAAQEFEDALSAAEMGEWADRLRQLDPERNPEMSTGEADD